MARNSFISDYLQSYPFFLLDVSPIDRVGLPLFTPIFGFSAITAPEMTVEIADFAEGNSLYRRKVVKRANVSPITMQRGSFFVDSDFYRWTISSLKGDPAYFNDVGPVSLGSIPGPSPRRNLLLVHFFSRSPFDLDQTGNNAIGLGSLAALSLGASALLSTEAGLGFTEGSLAATTVATSVAGFGAGLLLSPGDLVARIPAKAWLLYGCIPTRYKVASDFDAQSSAVSVQELDFEYEKFEEISLAA